MSRCVRQVIFIFGEWIKEVEIQFESFLHTAYLHMCMNVRSIANRLLKIILSPFCLLLIYAFAYVLLIHLIFRIFHLIPSNVPFRC